MAINQADILLGLDKNYQNLKKYDDKREYFYQFLHAYGLPKSTITLLKKGDASRSVGFDGDVALKRKIYFKLIDEGANLDDTMNALLANDVIARNDIRFILVTDLKDVVAYDITAQEALRTPLDILDKQYAFFLPLAGYEKAAMFSEHPADVKASEKMGRLFDLIKRDNQFESDEDVHALNVFLTRLLFCFYAEDTELFKEGQFSSAIQSYTKNDGHDLQDFLTELFDVLNTPDDKRGGVAVHLATFPYVNGALFKAATYVPEFNKTSRNVLLECATLNWSDINPDIFGSMFQAVVDTTTRGNLGQHYTSVPNIMKVLKPSFLDKLYADLDKARGNAGKLKELLIRVGNIRVFDPCAGSANFLIIAYKELRHFEMAVLDELSRLEPQMYFSNITLDQLYGIEIDDFASEIAVLSLWIAEHQMNNAFKEKFGSAPAALPLGKAGNILNANSLHVDWEVFCPHTDSKGNPLEVYICGNPPFLGDGSRSESQLEDMRIVLSQVKEKANIGRLDYIACFFWKAAKYAQKGGSVAFVSTNSICQGVQVPNLWPYILELGVEISFAYQSFAWSNNAKNQAGVHVVIIGLEKKPEQKRLFKMIDGHWQQSIVNNISPYLTDSGNAIVVDSRKPLCDQSLMVKGNMPTDGGHLLLNFDEKEDLIAREPNAEKYIKQYMGAAEFIRGDLRYCLWLVDATLEEIADMPLVQERVDKVKEMRLKSKAASTREILSKTSHLFAQRPHPKDGFSILVPIVSSERREYVPIGYFDNDVIINAQANMIPNGSFYELGIVSSTMQKVWMATIGSRLKSDFRYSSTLCYNTFPFPDATKPQRDYIGKLAEEVLLQRELHPGKTIAQMYDPDTMPAGLKQAHVNLDNAIERLYRDAPFRDDNERLAHLMSRYEKLIAAEKAK